MERLVDGTVQLPGVTRRLLSLAGSRWSMLDVGSADEFVRALVRTDVLALDPVVARALDGQPTGLSVRTVRRHFIDATGLAQQTILQIERSRRAASMIADGLLTGLLAVMVG